ncbi:molybdate ABC transporter substrate-binding protein [Anaerostipes sp. 494a]|uniref:molybdate ABC transporter substrate-binding protein n=1 Tax=Anaerostipes TaxID=207244 RepID=UPI0009535A28|nr:MULTISPECIES: molybdate ABC transporter substrate-binding protein [Anaerostipes]OLR58491.1 molybdate ABC transporter substrate-binding protein [Anaerostipes sp. 494a]
MKGKKLFAGLLAAVMACSVGGCGSKETAKKKETVTLSLAVAASLEKCYTEKLIPMFEKENEGIKVEGSYDSSGKLQTQIEQGMEADVFMSAATEQMDQLVKEDYIAKNDVVNLLENKLVLIVPKEGNVKITSYEDITKAETIAIGDPKSVSAGQYAQEVFKNLKNWDQVQKKASLGTNVTEVLNWVAKGSADCGVVYATDAASTKDVKVIAEASDKMLKTPVIYPVASLKNSKHKDAADKFVEFLQSKEALEVFEDYGFTIQK